MILTLMFLGLIILGIILMKLDYRFGIVFDTLGGVLITLFTTVSIFALIVILVAHVGINNEIEKNRIEYESLVARQEIVRSEYEDVSKSDVIRDVSEWNQMVQSNKYWGYSPWTDWFYSRKVVDELKFIE